ncbi:MAG: AI-2E family transporter, partial [Oscillospiraceae bacterium]|nr:AI-2E family transporter [Oscillospiraceae bacterium]
MPQNQAYLQRVLRTALFLAATLLFFRFLFVPLLPFLVALCLSALLEPPVQRLRRALGVRRSFAAVVLTTALLLVLGGTAAFFALRLGAQLSEWSSRLPQAIETFPALWNGVRSRMMGWYGSCPPFLRSFLDTLATALGENAGALIGKAGGFFMEKMSSLAAALPGAGLFAVTTVLALYFTAVNYNMILAFLKRQLPPAWQPRCRAAVQCCRGAILNWLRSELTMILVTFAVMLLGLSLLGYDFALLAACFIALV